ncbi:hypothetical protein MYXO_00160 [Myxococcaceae bacterium]|jgi:hypothetical protein|nr:hypothetical protein MYXO_00160 [Myxococcaceae bacterium]
MKLSHWMCACALALPLTASAADTPNEAGRPEGPSGVAVVRGPAVTSATGEAGHLHTVAPGETLWDVSEAYLGTPWVWPSLWKGEGSGAGASLSPGDVLFVSSTEIRPLSPAEAAALRPAAAESAPAALGDSYDADRGVGANAIDRWVAFNARGFIATQRPGLVGNIIGNPTERAALGSGDVVYLDLGAGDVEIGERLRVVRATRFIPDPDTGRLIGMFVEPLGFAEVTQLEENAAAAVLEGTVSEVMIGDKLLKAEAGDDLSLRPTSTSPELRGEIVHMVGERVLGGGMDVVYLDEGSTAGLVPGSALEVVHEGGMVFDPQKGMRVRVPDTIVGHMIVLTTTPESAAAYVLHSTTDLQRGDRWRGAEVR